VAWIKGVAFSEVEEPGGEQLGAQEAARGGGFLVEEPGGEHLEGAL